MLLRKGVLKTCSKFTGEPPCRSAISIKLLCNFIEIALRHGCSPVNLLQIFKTTFPRNKSGWLLLIKINFKIIIAKIILHTNSKYFKNISNKFVKTLDITSKLGQLPPRKLLPNPKSNRNSTLTLTRGLFSSGAIVWLPPTFKP